MDAEYRGAICLRCCKVNPELSDGYREAWHLISACSATSGDGGKMSDRLHPLSIRFSNLREYSPSGSLRPRPHWLLLICLYSAFTSVIGLVSWLAVVPPYAGPAGYSGRRHCSDRFPVIHASMRNHVSGITVEALIEETRSRIIVNCSSDADDISRVARPFAKNISNVIIRFSTALAN